MKRVKTKLLIILLIVAAGFAYQYTITINDTDIQKMAQQLVEQKLSSSQQKIFFKNVAVVKRNQYKDGEGVRVCGSYQVGESGTILPFVASVDVRDGKFSGHNQLLLSDTPEIEASIIKICQEEKS
ncbi:hypothetical protein AB7179_02145 [Providencia manganoxydans]|uniref:DUF1310 family protein n=1 Tax=Providencia manganoxydans TaxID=2923283 RepID=A0ABX7AJH1_9GAMM|nr:MULTISPECIES: hypothetical protein [Providencia]MDX4945049.1 hypothetical protein [Providencia manganoxydans]QQO64083.1 hypothetical protein JI723_09055 [Providencia manganoxydans]HEF8774904.1 hypothetical protein [Providencia stuartii]